MHIFEFTSAKRPTTKLLCYILLIRKHEDRLVFSIQSKLGQCYYTNIWAQNYNAIQRIVSLQKRLPELKPSCKFFFWKGKFRNLVLGTFIIDITLFSLKNYWKTYFPSIFKTGYGSVMIYISVVHLIWRNAFVV